MLRRGLKTRRVRRNLILRVFAIETSTIEVTTTNRSIQFQRSLKYAFLWNQKPYARIFIAASQINKYVVTFMMLSNA